MAPTAGILYVTMQPGADLPADEFNDWYSNEHGPDRLRLSPIFDRCVRYQATDGQQPAYLNVFDVVDGALLQSPEYTSLRANRSGRETSVYGRTEVDRSFQELVYTKEAPGFAQLDRLADREAEGLVLVAVDITLSDAEGAAEQYHQWFVDEHAEMLSKVPGYLRSRLFRTTTSGAASGAGSAPKVQYFALHDYAKVNGLGGPEHKASMDTPWRTKIFDGCVGAKGRRTFSLLTVLGPCPRDLASVASQQQAREAGSVFTSVSGKTSVTYGPRPVICSYVTTPDGLEIPYRLEGNPAPDAPTIAFSNSLLTSYQMWDRFLAIFARERPQYRILRYDTRGRHAIPQPPVVAKMEMLADDLRTLLDALRIARLDVLMGVSMGGSTTVNFAIKYPQRVGRFVASDFNYRSNEVNTKAWGERTAVAEQQGIAALADMTVRRWFHPKSVEDEPLTRWMIDHVAENDVQGFKYSCTALCDFDLQPLMAGCPVPCLLVAGEADGGGAIAKIIAGVKDQLGGKDGAELRIVPGAGHLPMYETPEAYWDAVKDYL